MNEEGRYALAYEVHLAGSPAPQSWRVFVDAQTGSVLEKENATMHLASNLESLPVRTQVGQNRLHGPVHAGTDNLPTCELVREASYPVC